MFFKIAMCLYYFDVICQIKGSKNNDFLAGPSSSKNTYFRLSVCHTFLTKFLSSYHPKIFRSYYHWQIQCPCKRSKVKVTEVMTPFIRFQAVTPVRIHIWWWNNAQSLMLLRRGTLLLIAARWSNGGVQHSGLGSRLSPGFNTLPVRLLVVPLSKALQVALLLSTQEEMGTCEGRFISRGAKLRVSGCILPRELRWKSRWICGQ